MIKLFYISFSGILNTFTCKRVFPHCGTASHTQVHDEDFFPHWLKLCWYNDYPVQHLYLVCQHNICNISTEHKVQLRLMGMCLFLQVFAHKPKHNFDPIVA